MKSIHWIIFAIAFWLTLVPFVAERILLALSSTGQTSFILTDVVSFLQINNLLFGLALGVLTLVAISTDAVTPKSDGARAMHWITVGISVWLAVSPFALGFTQEIFAWNNLILGIMTGIFTLVQLNVDKH